MSLDVLGQTAILAILILAVAAVLALGALAAMLFGPRRTLPVLAVLLPLAAWLVAPQFSEGGSFREFIFWAVATYARYEWSVMAGLLGVFTAMLWYGTDSATIVACFLPLAAVLSLLLAFLLRTLDSDNMLQLSDLTLLAFGTGLGAVLAAVIVVAVLRAIPQQVY